MSSEDVRRAKTARGRRELKKRTPKIHEGEKAALFMKGSTSSDKIKQVLIDLCTLKKPRSKMLTHKNPVRPFEDAGTIEFLSKANDASCFVFGSHSKKRPHSLVFGRTFDYQILDMIEFQMDPNTFASIQDLAASGPGADGKARLGAKPMFIFAGDAFDNSPPLAMFKNMLLDMFRGEEFDKINLAGLDRVYLVTAAVHPTDITKKIVAFRNYAVLKKKSGTRVPRVVLEEVGPRIDLTYNRMVEASADVRKAAMRQPRSLTAGAKKNVEEGLMGQRLGRVHMETQQLNELALAKLKGLGKGKRANKVNGKRGRDEMEGNGNDEYDNDDDRHERKSNERMRSGAMSDRLPTRSLGTVREMPQLSEERDILMPRSTKRMKKVPSQYLSSVTSE